MHMSVGALGCLWRPRPGDLAKRDGMYLAWGGGRSVVGCRGRGAEATAKGTRRLEEGRD